MPDPVPRWCVSLPHRINLELAVTQGTVPAGETIPVEIPGFEMPEIDGSRAHPGVLRIVAYDAETGEPQIFDPGPQ